MCTHMHTYIADDIYPDDQHRARLVAVVLDDALAAGAELHPPSLAIAPDRPLPRQRAACPARSRKQPVGLRVFVDHAQL